MSLSWALTLQGTIGEALDEAERAVPVLEGTARARMQAQRALILQRLGRLDDALAGYRRPLSSFRRVGDRLWEARLLVQPRRAAGLPRRAGRRRGRLRARGGAARGATARRSPRPRSATTSAGSRRGAATSPLALEWYDRVEAEYRAHGVPLALLFMDRCEVLLSARLATEARANALAAVAELEAAGMGSDLAEARLLAAQAELLVRRPLRRPRPRRPRRPRLRPPAPPGLGRARPLRGGASRVAGGGRHAAAGDGAARPRPARDARGDARRGARLEAALAAARRAIRALEAVGWGAEALDARLIAGRAALELGRHAVRAGAARARGRAAGSRARAAAHAGVARGGAAAALARRPARGERGGRGRAAGARGAPDDARRDRAARARVRARGGARDARPAARGRSPGTPRGSWPRRSGARRPALLLRPARPPDDEALANDLAELRRVTAALDESLREGRHDTALARRQTALENSVRRRARAPAATTRT